MGSHRVWHDWSDLAIAVANSAWNTIKQSTIREIKYKRLDFVASLLGRQYRDFDLLGSHLCQTLGSFFYFLAGFKRGPRDQSHPIEEAAAAAKSLQSCLTLCDPIEGSPSGSPSLGFSIWSGLPFPSPMHESEKSKWSRSVLSDSSRTPWTTAYQAPRSTGFSRQEYWSGLPLPSPDTNVY